MVGCCVPAALPVHSASPAAPSRSGRRLACRASCDTYGGGESACRDGGPRPPPLSCSYPSALAFDGRRASRRCQQRASSRPHERSLISPPPVPPFFPHTLAPASGPSRRTVTMGNKGAGGPFAPLVRAVRSAMGQKEFNQFRGKAISLHSQGGMVEGGGVVRVGGGVAVGETRFDDHPSSPRQKVTPSSTPHSVIKEFGKSIGVDNKQVQGLIRLAKKNGEKLGFLA